LIWGLIGSNVAVWSLWQMANTDRAMLSFMHRNFTASWVNIRSGRLWDVLTSVFSHRSLLHLFNNMFVLYAFGMPLATFLGSRRFAAVYLLSGIAGAAAHLATERWLVSDSPVIGASGAVFGLLTTYSAVWPRQTVWVLFVAMPAWAVAAGFLALDFVMPSKDVSRASHVGGAAAGILYYLFKLRPMMRR
jgi:membrane associated rhomboid family serine protease